jgi:hemerythrin-like metal-binding protein
MKSERDLLVGHPVIDAEHRAILNVVAEVRRLVDAGDASGVREAVAELWDVTVGHFATEEALMEEYAYPERVAHRGAHQLFLEDVKALLGELAERGLGEDAASWARQRVPEWITFHIETNDAPLARFLARKVAQRSVAAGRDPRANPTPTGTPPSGRRDA